MLGPRRPSDVVRALAERGQSGMVRFEGPLGVGIVWLKDGKVIDALVGNLGGRTALMCLLAQTRGAYHTQTGPVRRQRAIFDASSELLDPASTQTAEWESLLALGPPLLSVLSINHALLQAEHSFMDVRDVGLLKLAEQRRTVMEILDVSGLAALETMARLTKLVRLGFARVAAVRALPGAVSSHEPGASQHGYSFTRDQLTDPVLVHGRAAR